jgi:hypothetical protein
MILVLSLISTQFYTPGSSIVLYAGMINALTFEVLIDGGAQFTYHFDRVYGCCNDTIHQAYDVAIYHIPSLPHDTQALRLTLLYSTAGYVRDANYSDIYFDYAEVDSISPPVAHQ